MQETTHGLRNVACQENTWPNISQSPRAMNWAVGDASNGSRSSPGQAPAYGGTDFLMARDGRIAAHYLCF